MLTYLALTKRGVTIIDLDDKDMREKGVSRNCYCLSFYQHKRKVSANTKVSLLCSQVLEKTNDLVSSQTIMKTNECLEDL